MNKKKLLIYFLTESVDSVKERNEIEYLSQVGQVVLVSTEKSTGKRGLKSLTLKPHPLVITKLCVLWSKICYLLSKIANTASDRQFTVRNVYTGNKLVRLIVNSLWSFKNFTFVNRLLPTYDSLYFIPFKVAHAFLGRKRNAGRYLRIVVHDSLVFRLNKYPQFVTHARVNGIRTLANVKSWDNPFYSQMATNADGYLVWSQSMWQDIVKVHNLENRFVHIWGARPFYQYYEGFRKFQFDKREETSSQREKFVVGYAAAFCDELMGHHEIGLIRGIADRLRREIPEAQILFRPYPILPLSFYSELQQCPNITLVDIDGGVVKYDNGSVITNLRIGSDVERFSYLERCSCFLSIATSFTIEAAIFGVPVVHFYLPPEDCTTQDEIEFFKRIFISDHLLEYFNKELLFAASYAELLGKLLSTQKSHDLALRKGHHLLQRMGVPTFPGEWPSPAGSDKSHFMSLVETQP